MYKSLETCGSYSFPSTKQFHDSSQALWCGGRSFYPWSHLTDPMSYLLSMFLLKKQVRNLRFTRRAVVASLQADLSICLSWFLYSRSNCLPHCTALSEGMAWLLKPSYGKGCSFWSLASWRGLYTSCQLPYEWVWKLILWHKKAFRWQPPAQCVDNNLLRNSKVRTTPPSSTDSWPSEIMTISMTNIIYNMFKANGGKMAWSINFLGSD